MATRFLWDVTCFEHLTLLCCEDEGLFYGRTVLLMDAPGTTPVHTEALDGNSFVSVIFLFCFV